MHNMTVSEYSRDIENKLESSICLVSFIKADGTARIMIATANTAMASQYLGRPFFNFQKINKVNTIKVVDLEIAELRAINLSRIIKIHSFGVFDTNYRRMFEDFQRFKSEYSEVIKTLSNEDMTKGIMPEEKAKAAADYINKIFEGL